MNIFGFIIVTIGTFVISGGIFWIFPLIYCEKKDEVKIAEKFCCLSIFFDAIVAIIIICFCLFYQPQQVNIALHASTLKESILSMPLVYKIAIFFVDVLNLMASIIVSNMVKKKWKSRRYMVEHYY